MLLCAFHAKPQYFYDDRSLMNQLAFENSELSDSYRQLRSDRFVPQKVAQFLQTYPIASGNYANVKDLLNYHMLSALHNSLSGDARQTLYNVHMAENLSQKNGDLSQQQVNRMESIVYSRLGLLDEANQFSELAALEEKQREERMQIYYREANNLNRQGKYREAIAILEQYLPLSQSVSDYDYHRWLELLTQVAENNNDNGLALNMLLKHDTLLGSLDQSRNLFSKKIYYQSDTLNAADIRLLKIISANNLGIVYQKLGDHLASEKFLLRSIRLLTERKYASPLKADIETNIALTYTHLKRYADAEKHYQAAYAVYRRENNKARQAVLLNMLAKNSLLGLQSELAVNFAEESLALSLSSNDYDNASDSYFILSEIYAYNADYNKSQLYYKEFTKFKTLLDQKAAASAKARESHVKSLTVLGTEISDEIEAAEKRQLELIRFKLESNQRDQELLLLKKDNEIKAQNLLNQKLEREQAEKSLALVKEQLEKHKFEEKYNAARLDRELKLAESVAYKNQVELLNSQKGLIMKDNILKAKELDNTRRTQFFLFTGICLIFLFLVFALYAFFRNRKQTAIIRRNVAELQQLSGELQQTNSQLASKVGELDQQRKIVEEKNDLIIDSINYSSRIQASLFLGETQLRDLFASAFVINLPRDIVSGDFYLVKEQGHLTYVAMVDCTGHGVPGSLISIIGYQEISYLIESGYPDPAELLRKLNQRVNRLVNNHQGMGSDGMDVMLLEINRQTRLMRFAGARGYLMLQHGDEMREFKGDRISIGERVGDDIAFTTHAIQLDAEDTLYLFTDGYQDQQGGESGKRFGSKKFKELIKTCPGLPMEVQKQRFLKAFEEHKGNMKQTDDVTILALQPKFTEYSMKSMIYQNPKIKEQLYTVVQREKMPTNLVVVYGKINQEVIVSTIRLIERKLTLENYSRNLTTRVKMLSTEMMQNVHKHQIASQQITPYFIISTDHEQLWLCSGNVVDAGRRDFLASHLERYSSLGAGELKGIYLDSFANASLSPEGNAGLGLLTILYKSNQKIAYDMIQVSDSAYHFNLEVSLPINTSYKND